MKVVISGYGKMGHMVEEILHQRGIECCAASEDIKNIHQSLDQAATRECVCIDFTTPQAIHHNYKFLCDNFKAVVIGTTGWNDIKEEVVDYFTQKGTTMIYASNFSIGVNLLFAAVDLLSRDMELSGDQYSPYIIEMHHIHKLDAPSGTAKSLEEIIQGNMHRHVDVQSVRCGEIPGIHTCGFEGADDRITISHEAFSRRGFATGAVEAALKADTLKGVYNFKDIIFHAKQK